MTRCFTFGTVKPVFLHKHSSVYILSNPSWFVYLYHQSRAQTCNAPPATPSGCHMCVSMHASQIYPSDRPAPPCLPKPVVFMAVKTVDSQGIHWPPPGCGATVPRVMSVHSTGHCLVFVEDKSSENLFTDKWSDGESGRQQDDERGLWNDEEECQ